MLRTSGDFGSLLDQKNFSRVVRLTERGAKNYVRVRREWGEAVSGAAAHDTNHLDAALRVLAKIEGGLIEKRPRKPGRNMDRASD